VRSRATCCLWTYAGHSSFVELLLEAGADISAGDSRGFVAVQYACYTGGLSILKRLLEEKGATTRPRGSQACEDLARRQGYEEVADWVAKYDQRQGKKKAKAQKRKKRQQQQQQQEGDKGEL
jgi:ankyrin repeat protein